MILPLIGGGEHDWSYLLSSLYLLLVYLLKMYCSERTRIKMLTIDRFEGEYALIKLNKRVFHIPKVLLPKGAKPGDRVRIEITVEEDSLRQAKE